MSRAVVRNGMVQPLEPLPADWNDGRQVVVEEMEACALEAREVDRWSSEMDELTAELNDAEEWQEIETALAEADHEAKAVVRREMGLGDGKYDVLSSPFLGHKIIGFLDMSQVNFFMTEDDEDTFLDFLFSRKDTHVLSERFFDSHRPSLLVSKEDVGKIAELTLVNKDIMPLPDATSHGCGEYEGKYLFDLFRDPTIEFSRSQLSKRRLLNGRIYAKIGWLKPKEANAVYKSWYGSIERWLKKRYRRVDKMWWFGPGAWEWSMAGGVCCFGDELAFAASLANVDRDWIEN